MIKRIYIKPEAELLSCDLTMILTASTSTKPNVWNTQIGDGGTNTEVGENEPDPGEE